MTSGTGVCSITATKAGDATYSSGANGATIALAATGLCTVKASQAGDANYAAAAAVEQSFLVQGGVRASFAGLFDPWRPPGPGTYNGVTFTEGRVYKMNSTLPVKWGYSLNGILVDSSRSTTAEYPVVTISGPLADCGNIDGTGFDSVVSYTGAGSTTTTYDPTSRTWQRNIKLDSTFQADRCYLIQVSDAVSGVTSPWFAFKTKK